MTSLYTGTITAGWGRRREVRDYLTEQKLKGNLDFAESSGWFESKFFFKEATPATAEAIEVWTSTSNCHPDAHNQIVAMIHMKYRLNPIDQGLAYAGLMGVQAGDVYK